MQNRYYFEINQTKLVESKARTLLSNHPEYKCDCTVCNDKDAPTIDEFFNTMENFDYRYHFMEKVHKIRTESINEIKQGLENSIDEINQKGLQNFGVTANLLNNWFEVFEHMLLSFFYINNCQRLYHLR